MLVFWLKLPIMEDLEVLVLGNVWNVVYIIIETLWNASIAITTCGIIALITLLGVALHFVEWTFVALASACCTIHRWEPTGQRSSVGRKASQASGRRGGK